jgi:hypothetical protein
MHVYGSNQNEWKAALLSRIAEDQLPFTLGGTVVPAGTHSMEYKMLVYGRRYSIFAEAVKEQEPEDEDGPGNEGPKENAEAEPRNDQLVGNEENVTKILTGT